MCNTCDRIAGGDKVWGVGGVKKQRSAVGTALCGAFVLDTNSPHPAEMHRSGFWEPFATKRYKELRIREFKEFSEFKGSYNSHISYKN